MLGTGMVLAALPLAAVAFGRGKRK